MNIFTQKKRDRFKKKPVEVQAHPFELPASVKTELDALNDQELARAGVHFCCFREQEIQKYRVERDARGYYLSIPTLEGTMRGNEGDWIIFGVAGEPYPCKPDIFSKTYEAV